MTPEQLVALMGWINNRILDSVEHAGDEDRMTRQSRSALYEAFGFDEGPGGDPVAPGTYPPTTGGLRHRPTASLSPEG